MSILPKKFQKKREDFTCDRCGFFVKGTGYTNHCPQCLWSKHVDINPGDRAASCGGMMEPIRAEVEKGGEQVITHRCIICGHEKRNKMSPDDDMSELIRILYPSSGKNPPA